MKLIFSLLLFGFICSNLVSAQDIDAITARLKTDRQKADTLFYFAVNNLRKGKFQRADFLLNKGNVFAERTGDNKLIAMYIVQGCYIHLLTEEFKEGLSLLEKCYPHLAKASSYELNRKYLYLKGRFNESLHRNDSAIYYYHQLELLNNRENPYQNWVVFNQMGQMFKASDAYAEAEKYFSKAYNITKPRGVRMDHVSVLSEFADLYYQWRKPDKFAAIMYEQQQMMDASKKDFSKDPVHSMMFIDWKKKSLDSKLSFMKNVKQELTKNGHIVKAALANNYIAGFFEEAGQPDSALKYIRENQWFFDKEKDILNLYSNTIVAYRLLKKAGRKSDALEEADKLFAMKDTIISLQKRETMLDLEIKYETEKKEKDIVLLNAENELSAFRLTKETVLKEALLRENLLKDSVVSREKDYNNLLAEENKLRKSQLVNEKELKAALSRENILKGNELAKEKKIRWQLTLGTLLLLLSGVVIFLMYRKQRSKNILIQKQADDLQMLMKEIHHRVKNNLQVISSLLDLQSLTIKDKQASEAIKESRNRVYSMALIHQNFYKEEKLLGIEMKDYINKLVESLFQSYNSGEQKISLETDIDPVLLDVDVVIPIGLVLNELISNSLKYAFNNETPGKLQIAFKKNGDEMLLKVKDNGRGFPIGMNVFKSQSFGYKLIKAFAQKLKARLEVYNDDGACILLHIKKIKFA
ncbi:MAG: sensor histidine kinase [Ginsengibacter sp.]